MGTDSNDIKDQIEQLIGKTYKEIGVNNIALLKDAKVLLQSRRIPDEPWTDLELDIWIRVLSSMDCNNRKEIISIGEREGRVFAPQVHSRHYGLAHGIGRSGDLTALQPKAPGSALLVSLTTLMVADLIKRGCGIQSMVGKPLLMPVATGLSISMCLQTIMKQFQWKRSRVLFSRIDQKSAVKAILNLNVEIDSVPQIRSDENQDLFQTDITKMRELILKNGSSSYYAIYGCTSCFAPRSPDNVEDLAKLSQEFKIPLIINNAYGLGCTKTTQNLQNACANGRVDYVIQSLDKNLQVPVSGTIVFSNQKDNIDSLAKFYPGRASSSHVIDLHFTLLLMGMSRWKSIRKERRELFLSVKSQLESMSDDINWLQFIPSPDNKVSLCFSIDSKYDNYGTEIGSRLYHRGVSGMRCVTISPENHRKNKNFGSHGLWDEYTKKNLFIFAVVLGSRQKDYDLFFASLKKCIDDLKVD